MFSFCSKTLTAFRYNKSILKNKLSRPRVLFCFFCFFLNTETCCFVPRRFGKWNGLMFFVSLKLHGKFACQSYSIWFHIYIYIYIWNHIITEQTLCGLTDHGRSSLSSETATGLGSEFKVLTVFLLPTTFVTALTALV